MGITTARAGANIALVKYWGKRDESLNLPAVGSISITLDGLLARVSAEVAQPGVPRFRSRGMAVEGTAADRMVEYVDWLGAQLGVDEKFAVDVDASFPVGAGLASSAAIYCATATAIASQIEANLSLTDLSRFARVGSGSAARSVFGGFVEWVRGDRPDGEDSVAAQLVARDEWPLGVVVVIARRGMKEIPSRDAMRHVAATSALYPAWVGAQGDDLASARRAIESRDLTALGALAEENCLRMHAVTLAARPPIQYWTPVTLSVMDEVRKLRAEGHRAYFTIDAGPQVKVICPPEEVPAIREALGAVPGVVETLTASLGRGVEVLEGHVPWK